jgi:hypothetical protein
MSDELEHFKNKYRAHVQDGQRRYAVPKRLSMDPLSPSYEPFDLNFEYESSVQIDMPKRDFETLIGMEKYWEEQLSWRDINQYSGHAKSIIDKHEKELRIRNNNPAAKKAYEKYQNLLRLVDSYYD